MNHKLNFIKYSKTLILTLTCSSICAQKIIPFFEEASVELGLSKTLFEDSSRFGNTIIDYKTLAIAPSIGLDLKKDIFKTNFYLHAQGRKSFASKNQEIRRFRNQALRQNYENTTYYDDFKVSINYLFNSKYNISLGFGANKGHSGYRTNSNIKEIYKHGTFPLYCLNIGKAKAQDHIFTFERGKIAIDSETATEVQLESGIYRDFSYKYIFSRKKNYCHGLKVGFTTWGAIYILNNPVKLKNDNTYFVYELTFF